MENRLRQPQHPFSPKVLSASWPGYAVSAKTLALLLLHPETRFQVEQIEIWFSILVRKLLRRSSFKSIAELRQRIEVFIAYFKETMAQPFRWTFSGKPLAACAARDRGRNFRRTVIVSYEIQERSQS